MFQLGARPQLGTLFGAEDEDGVLLTHATWTAVRGVAALGPDG